VDIIVWMSLILSLWNGFGAPSARPAWIVMLEPIKTEWVLASRAYIVDENVNATEFSHSAINSSIDFLMFAYIHGSMNDFEITMLLP
jgi:polyisoprenoid-binding protein YceI